MDLMIVSKKQPVHIHLFTQHTMVCFIDIIIHLQMFQTAVYLSNTNNVRF